MLDDDFRIRFWDIVCDHDGLLKAALSVNVVLLVMLLLAAPGVERGTASHVVMVVNFAILIPLTFVTGYLALRCERRERVDRF